MIDDNITITVVEIRGDKVRLGIQAPREVPIHRSEVYEALKALSDDEVEVKVASPDDKAD